MNISVIVPVYNVEEYLHYAVESLWKIQYICIRVQMS